LDEDIWGREIGSHKKEFLGIRGLREEQVSTPLGGRKKSQPENSID